MEQYRQTYVERELCRRRIEKRYRVITKINKCIAGAAVIIVAEFLMFSLALMC